MSLPTLVSEAQIRPFSYYWKAQIRSGMVLHRRLFALVDCFGDANRTSAYERGCRLSEHLEVVITVSSPIRPQYRLWVELSARTEHHLLDLTPQSCAEKVKAAAFSGSVPLQAPSDRALAPIT
jgi:hypothetical protein